MLDPDFSVTAWGGLQMSTLRPEAAHRGHHAPGEWRGVWVPLALVWGRSVHQLLGQVEEGGTRPCGVEMVEFLSCWLIERGARAQSCLIDGKGRARKVRGLAIFLLLLVAAKS
jgi:hypothetical protein